MKNKQKGFTLMEVLITIGLVAILTAIAVPSYRNYLRTANRVEAQTSLSQLYMAEKAFYLQWRFYTSDLVVAGVSPDGALIYRVGFNTQSPGTAPTAYKGPTMDTARNDFYTICGQSFGSGTIEGCAFKYKKTSITPPDINTVGGTNPCTPAISNDEFTAMAIADLINKKAPKNRSAIAKKDIWCINQYKEVTNPCDGTKASNTCP